MSRQVLGSAIVAVLLLGALAGAATGQVMEAPEHTVTSVMLDAGDVPVADLAYAWEEGHTESLSLELWHDETRRLGDLVVEDYLPVPIRVDATVTVERVDRDGSALVLTTIEDVALIGDPVGAAGHALAVDVETLVGVTARAKLDAKGYVIASAVFDPDAEADDRHPARGTAIDLLEHPTMRLPLEPVGVGGVWQETVITTGDDGPDGTETHTKTLSGIDADGRLLVESGTVVDIPVQELSGEDFGLDVPVAASGEAAMSASARIDLSRVGPVGSIERSATMEVELPVGKGVVVGVEQATAAILTAPGADESSWPVLSEPPEQAVRVATDDAGSDESAPGTIDVVVLDPGAEPRQLLRYRLQEGLEEHVVTTVRTGVRTTVDGEWTPWIGTPAIQLASTSTVTGVREDGSFDIEVVSTDVNVVPGSGQLTPEAQEQMQAQLSGLVGMRQTLHMDDRGRILSAWTSLPPGSDPSLLPGQLDAVSQELVDPLPEEPVGAGAVWEVARETSDAMGFLGYGSSATTLVELLPDGRLALEGELQLTADPGPMTLPDMDFVDATLERFSMDGTFIKTVDPGSLNPVGSSRGLSDYAFTITFGETTQATEMQTSMEFEFRPLDPASIPTDG